MSDILIRGMELPEDKEICLRIDEKGEVYVYGSYPTELHKAIPVPPHGRLGDLDRLEQMFADIDHAPYSGFDGLEPFYSAEDAAQIIRLSPTIIPAEEGET